MTDETNQPQAGNKPDDKPQAGEKTSPYGTPLTGDETRLEVKDFPPEAQRMIEELRKENAKHRSEKKKAEDDARKAQDKQLEEQQKWKELADSRGQSLTELESLREKAEMLESAFNANTEARLAKFPAEVRLKTIEPVRKTMNALDFAKWLDANERFLGVPKAPHYDPGAGGAGNGKDTSKIPPEAKAGAELAGRYGYKIDPAAVAARAKQIADERLRRPQVGREPGQEKDKE